MPLRALVAVIVTTVVMLVPRAWADTAWERYKARFMMPDGRIIDTANGNGVRQAVAVDGQHPAQQV